MYLFIDVLCHPTLSKDLCNKLSSLETKPKSYQVTCLGIQEKDIGLPKLLGLYMNKISEVMLRDHAAFRNIDTVASLYGYKCQEEYIDGENEDI